MVFRINRNSFKDFREYFDGTNHKTSTKTNLAKAGVSVEKLNESQEGASHKTSLFSFISMRR